MANSYFGFGTRKNAVAKVHISAGTGNLTLVTGNLENRQTRDVQGYFCDPFKIENFLFPLKLIGKADKIDVNIFVKGGGIGAQSEAIKLSIARAILAMDPSFKPLLKTSKLLTQDRRVKERKKVGKRGARRAPQFTKR